MKTFLALFPSLLAGIVGIEQAIKAPGQTKKQLLLNVIEAGAKTGEDTPIPQVSEISALIDATVTTLNEAGVFGHAGNQTPATIVPAPAVAA